MDWLRRGLGIAGAVTIAALAAPVADARNVGVHVAIPKTNGYYVSIDAVREPRRWEVLPVAGEAAAATAPAPLRALEGAPLEEAGPSPIRKFESATRRHRSGSVRITVSNRSDASLYEVAGTVTRHRLYAEFGDLGRISLHFQARPGHGQRRSCRPPHERRGTFTGRIRLRGEDDYLDIARRRAKGRVAWPANTLICLAGSRGRPKADVTSRARPRHRELETYLFAYTSGGVARSDGTRSRSDTRFVAYKEARQATTFLVNTFERSGPLRILRIGSADGRPADLTLNKRATRAHVRPSPRAFRGTAEFRAPHHFRGDLATSLPGAPRVPLAGPAFEAELFRDPFR